MSVLLQADLRNAASDAVWFDLDELLESIRPWGEPLQWCTLGLWALFANDQVFLGDDRVIHTDGGRLDPACGDISKQLSFAELVAFAAFTHQVVDGLFVGVPAGGIGPASAPRIAEGGYLRLDDAWFRAYPIVLHAWDSTHWRIFVRDAAAATQVLKRLPYQTKVLARW